MLRFSNLGEELGNFVIFWGGMDLDSCRDIHNRIGSRMHIRSTWRRSLEMGDHAHVHWLSLVGMANAT